MKLNESVQKTIDYAARYGCLLSKDEIVFRLISNKVYDQEEINKYKTLRPAGTSLDREALIKTKRAEYLVKEISVRFKDILMIGITGSVAAGYPNKKDDIDLMVITKKNRLWLTRLKLRWFMYKNDIPHRKYDQKENENEFCFNLWLDENNLLIPKSRQKLRSAMDLILMKPILNKDDVYKKFILKNSWAKKYVATGYKQICHLEINNSEFKNVDKKRFAILIDNFFCILNFLLFIPQYFFMKKKIRRELVGLKWAFFHSNG